MNITRRFCDHRRDDAARQDAPTLVAWLKHRGPASRARLADRVREAHTAPDGVREHRGFLSVWKEVSEPFPVQEDIFFFF